jgi:hypothetical protein
LAWLAKLDARASKWPKPLSWSYFALKWYLVFVGAYALLFAFSQNDITQGLNRLVARLWT